MGTPMILRWMAATTVFVGFVLASLIAILGGTYTADRKLPLDVKEVEVLTPLVKAGGMLKLRFVVEKYRDCSIHSDRVLFDAKDQREVLNDVDFFMIPNEKEFVSVIQVPAWFTPGAAYYESRTQYRCNILHNIWPIEGGERKIKFSVN